MRTRKQLARERTSQVQRLQKTLDDAHIELDSVISDIVGVSGWAMIQALIEADSDRFLLRLHPQQIDALDAAIDEINREVDLALEPFRT